MSPSIAELSPSAAVASLTAGTALIAIELNRPGSILPGACGLVLSLLAVAALLARHPQMWALGLLILAAALLLVQLRQPMPIWVAGGASMALFAGFFWILPRGVPGRVHPAVAGVCALVLGAGTTVLTRIARRARTNKGLD